MCVILSQTLQIKENNVKKLQEKTRAIICIPTQGASYKIHTRLLDLPRLNVIFKMLRWINSFWKETKAEQHLASMFYISDSCNGW